MAAYYNEFEPFAAAWLRELIKDGLIADGVVDERSICDVEPNELKEFTQCHFFAGIGGWSYALRLANWPDERHVWTGSPPCQPFSVAGKGKGKEDERHLWPVFFNLIRECNPTVVFGEQVASAIRTGWFDDLQADMETEGYATGMVVLPAASIGAPHKRDRLFYVAESCRKRLQGGECTESDAEQARERRASASWATTECSVNNSPLGNTDSNGREPWCEATEAARQGYSNDTTGWANSRPIYCRDGKYRPIPIEPSLFPLANGISNRVGILRGAGNAIVPQVAAEVINAYMELDHA